LLDTGARDIRDYPSRSTAAGLHNFVQQDIDCTFSPAPRLAGGPGSFSGDQRRLADTTGTITGHSDIVLSDCADAAGQKFECPTFGPAEFTHKINLQGSYDVTLRWGSGTYSFPAGDLPTSGEWYVE
jgi:hypothetical protein